MALSNFDIEVSNLNIDEGDTVEDTMNIPFTTVVDAPVQDFGALYPHNQAESDEDEQMNKHRRQIEEKLRAQVSAQELESKMAAAKDITEQCAAQDTYHDDESDTEVTRGLSLSQELPDTNTNKPSPPTPPPSHTRCSSEPTLSPNTSSTIGNTHSSPTPNPPPPSKHRRNLVSRNIDFQRPHYGIEEEEEEEEEEQAALADLEQYRTIDLAPLEPIMQSSTAGDLITHGTPIKVRDVDIFRVAG